MLPQETGRYCHYDFTGPFFFCILMPWRQVKSVRRMRSRIMKLCVLRGLGGLPSTSVWGYVDSHKHCLPVSQPFLSVPSLQRKTAAPQGCCLDYFLIALTRAIMLSSCSFGRVFASSISSFALVGLLESTSKKSRGVIPK